MATVSQWVEARPKTLPVAVAPVLIGTAAAYAAAGWRFDWYWSPPVYSAYLTQAIAGFDVPEVSEWRWAQAGQALLALLVALALQVAVNYANDYSDGIRGTDDDRVGPLRLTGSGAATPGQVRAAAFASFAVAGVAGFALIAWTGHWWLLAVGVICVLAAWHYTGGTRPYGYAGLGEVSVFVFFGLVATLGTTYTQLGHVTWASLLGAVGTGTLACAVLVANNLRDEPTDGPSGKATLAVRIGAPATRRLYLLLVVVPFVTALIAALLITPWAALGLLALPPAVPAARAVAAGALGPALLPVLRQTGRLDLIYAITLSAGLVLARH